MKRAASGGKGFIFLPLLVLNILLSAQAQDDGSAFVPPYNRIGLTPVLLTPDSVQAKHPIKEAFRALEIPSKFDKNKIQGYKVHARLPDTEALSSISDAEEEKAEKKSRKKKKGNRSGQEQLQNAGNILLNEARQELESTVTTQLQKNFEAPLYDSLVLARLKKEKVAHEVLDSIYSADADGRYAMDRLLKRARYNLTDAQVKRLEQTAKGVEGSAQDMEWANKVLTSNYIYGFYFHDIKSMETIYDNKDTPEEERVFTGYKAMVTSYLLRIDMNDSVRTVFYNNCWAGESASDEELMEAKKARKKMEYPLEKTGTYHFKAEAKKVASEGKRISQNQLLKELVQNAFQNGIRAIENDVASFKVRSSVFNYKGFPFPRAWAKLGTKEGMEPDDRYFVYEYVAGEGDTVVKKRRGVLRASHIVNNDSFSSGGTDPSRFVQTAGWGLGKGMLIQQEPDVGLGISLGWLGHGSDAQYLNAQLEMRISKALGLSPAWYLYGDAGINTGSGTTGQDEIEDLKVVHEDGDSATYETDIQVNGYGAGIRKEFYFMHHFQFAPYLGFRMENSRFTTDSLDQYVKDEIEGYGKTWTIDAGARVGINLTYWLKLTGSVGFSPLSYGAENTFFGKTPNPETDAEGALTIPVLREKEENPFYQERNDLKWSLMLRATF